MSSALENSVVTLKKNHFLCKLFVGIFTHTAGGGDVIDCRRKRASNRDRQPRSVNSLLPQAKISIVRTSEPEESQCVQLRSFCPIERSSGGAGFFALYGNGTE